MKKSFMMVTVGAFFACAQIPAVSSASTVNMETCPIETSFSCITGIDSLNILGTNYDMTVVTGEFSTLFSDPESQLLSWGNQAFGDAASNAIVQAINDIFTTSTKLKFDDSLFDDRSESILHFPVEFNPEFGFDGPCTSMTIFGFASASGCSKWALDDKWAFASFAPATVPIPAAVWLFGTGLIGLIGVARRKKA